MADRPAFPRSPAIDERATANGLDATLAALARADDPGPARPVLLVRPSTLDGSRERIGEAGRSFLDAAGFDASAGRVATFPGIDGAFGGLACGIGDRDAIAAGGTLATVLPGGTWSLDQSALAASELARGAVALGFCLGFDRVLPVRDGPGSGVLAGVDDCAEALAIARAVRFGRGLVNCPANLLGPAELADTAAGLAARYGARPFRAEADALARDYPAVHAVGRGSARRPVVAGFDWRGSGAGAGAPTIALVGKVCFDSGGYDLKTSSGMLRMKKDMGGAAVVLALAALAMARDLPLRLVVRIGCVENSVSGDSMRPGDVIATRAGIDVEISTPTRKAGWCWPTCSPR